MNHYFGALVMGAVTLGVLGYNQADTSRQHVLPMLDGFVGPSILAQGQLTNQILLGLTALVTLHGLWSHWRARRALAEASED